jgi:hypothetical protein
LSLQKKVKRLIKYGQFGVFYCNFTTDERSKTA